MNSFIGNTPLIKLNRITDGSCADIYVKFEGTNVWAAKQRARELGPGKKIVTVIIDSGLRYLNGDLYK